MGKQMTATAGAPVDSAGKWSFIDWDKARGEVRRLQMRIAKAVKEERWGKVKALQYLLTHSFYANALAVKRVTSNKEADANPYDPKYSYYFWRKRNQKDSRLLPSLSAREHRQKQAA